MAVDIPVIIDYATLRAAFNVWTKRKHLDNKFNICLQLAETRMLANPQFPLALRQEEERSTITLAGQYLPLPDRFKEMRRMRLLVDNGAGKLNFQAPQQMLLRTGTGQPHFFTIGCEIEFDIVPDDTYTVEMKYLADVAPLTSINNTNKVLTKYPAIYFYGTLWAAMEFNNDAAMAQKWQQLFLDAVSGANDQSEMGRYGDTPAMRIEGATP